MQSAEIGHLAKALSLAHGKMKGLGKGKEALIEGKDGKRGYSYHYADLADVIDVYRGPLSEAHLAVTQVLRISDGHMVLVTRLMHESGQFIESEYPLTNYSRPQEQGSAITYARRYTVTALLGIAAEEDDDGKRAQDSSHHDEEQFEQADPKAMADASAILDLAAAAVDQGMGKNIDAVIEGWSGFEKDGKRIKFSDPRRKLGNPGWLASTRRRAEEQFAKLRAKEPGAAEGAAVLR